MQADRERLRYDSSHWAREEDEAVALDQYLRLADRVYNRTKFKFFMAMAGDVAGRRILDYGGGAGILAVPYAKAGADVVIVDAEAASLRTARFYARREGVEDRVRTIHAESFPAFLKDERFDIVIAKDIAEHIPDDERFLESLAACQGPGGLLILSTQNSVSLNHLVEGAYQRYWLGNKRWYGWDQTHVRFYTPGSLTSKLKGVGYAPSRWASVYLVPYDLLSWLVLLRRRIEIPALHYLDLTLGRMFPFNRLGWNVVVAARRR